MNRYTETVKRYFSDEDALYTVEVVIEEDGTWDQWAKLSMIGCEDVYLSATGVVGEDSALQNVIMLRDLLNDVIRDNTPDFDPIVEIDLTIAQASEPDPLLDTIRRGYRMVEPADFTEAA